MADGIFYSEKTKEELIEVILEQQERIKELEAKIKEEQTKRVERFVKANVAAIRRRRPGRKAGHEGVSRCLPDQIDEVINQELSTCPECQNTLQESIDVIEQIQEDIIPARVVVRKYRRHRYYCDCCQKVITAPYHGQQIPRARLGAQVLIQAAILKYYHCLPYRKIAGVFEDMCGLKVTSGALAQALQRISQWLEVEEKVVLEAIRGSPQVHIDETGWRMDGKNHWLWVFANERMAYYKIDQSRGRRIVESTLPKGFKGTIITDFYGVYFKLPYKRQKCLVHLLREFRRCAQTDTSEAYQRCYKHIKRLINDAVKLQSIHQQLEKKVYERRYWRLKRRLLDIMVTYRYRNKNLKRLAKRFSKYWLDMFTFVENPAVAWNNNLAERMIRPNVIYRNRSFGNRSKAGAKAHSVMMSLIQTLILQNKNVEQFLKTAFVSHRQGNLTPFLSID